MKVLVPTLRERVARAIYSAAFDPRAGRPSPGWCWEKAGEAQQAFALRQADAAIEAIRTAGVPVKEVGK